MSPPRLIKTFTDRYPLLGPIIWMLSLQYYVIQYVVARDWATPFSWSTNTISDLGNTACGAYAGRFVCSPLHSLMNASFITLGITMALGSALIYQEFRERSNIQIGLIGFSCVAVGGIGTVMVGLFPENTISGLHIIGAALPFLIGNIGLVVLSWALDMPKTLRIYTFLTGAISLIALIFFASQHYLGLEIGGMERLTAYPQTIWLVFFGTYMSRDHVMRRSRATS